MILGITGPIGSGKGVVTEFFKKQGFSHFSARAFLKKEAKRRGLPVTRDVLIDIATELRVQHHPGYIIEQLYVEAEKEGTDAIIESIRSPAEIELLKEKGPFTLIAVDTNQHLRYERILQRKLETDNVSFGDFRRQEKKEAENTDPNKQNINACIAAADFTVNNDGTLEELHEKLQDVLKCMQRTEHTTQRKNLKLHEFSE